MRTIHALVSQALSVLFPEQSGQVYCRETIRLEYARAGASSCSDSLDR